MSQLVLFDVDGTLLLTHDEVYVEANRTALTEVFGSPVEAPDLPGDTALAHTRCALHRAGRPQTEIDTLLPAWCEAFSNHYVDLLARADTSHWVIAPHAREAIEQVAHRALLTGNPEAVARARLERMGLADLFPEGAGAFGCEHEDRVALFELARARAGAWPANATVAVGDTPLDVESAHAAGARCVAVMTGTYREQELRGADAVVDALADVPAALAALSPAPS